MNFEDRSTQKIEDNGESDRMMGERWTGCTEFPMLDGVSVPEVLSADVVGSTGSSLAVCGVLDTARRCMLVGAYTLLGIESVLA